ncbi:related to GTPase-activating protein gyp10 [Cephalotrichum gorgonifer]|uniref:Related to GTPase-activating protein gyp10 n=1 Tax=Cephalotrichum gorgonifer TaxID=2041049 RepID=A0AAE8N4F3_9PEZI|nr:related to GTPase-activating protein gyp10 [Cephalotrichum gorgonifer]
MDDVAHSAQSSRHSSSPEKGLHQSTCDFWDSEKEPAIKDACAQFDVPSLKALAQSEGGFLTDDLRRQAWPILLGHTTRADDASDSDPSHRSDLETPWQELPRHGDEDQVQLDVNRAFIYYPDNLSDSELAKRKTELSDLITEVLRRHPFLCYFQGYHDICQVFLLVLDPPLRAPLVARLSILRIRDFMLPTLSPTVAQLRLLPDILNAADSKLRRHLSGTEPFYALAGMLTMYAHNIEAYGDIARLFDVFIVREPVFSVYLFAQIVLSRREELFETSAEDPSMLHSILSKVPKELDLESLISDSIALLEKYPPTTLPSWRRISSSSCLKTARSDDSCTTQSLEDGRRFFQVQLAELRRAERWEELTKRAWVYRRPAGVIGTTVLVAIVAVYLRKHPAPVHYMTSILWRWLGRVL